MAKRHGCLTVCGLVLPRGFCTSCLSIWKALRWALHSLLSLGLRLNVTFTADAMTLSHTQTKSLPGCSLAYCPFPIQFLSESDTVLPVCFF